MVSNMWREAGTGKENPPAALPFHMLSSLVTVVIIKTPETHPDAERKQRSCDRGGYETSCSDEPFSSGLRELVVSRINTHTSLIRPPPSLLQREKTRGFKHSSGLPASEPWEEAESQTDVLLAAESILASPTSYNRALKKINGHEKRFFKVKPLSEMTKEAICCWLKVCNNCKTCPVFRLRWWDWQLSVKSTSAAKYLQLPCDLCRHSWPVCFAQASITHCLAKVSTPSCRGGQ